jgi:rare lipoprotein A
MKKALFLKAASLAFATTLVGCSSVPLPKSSAPVMTGMSSTPETAKYYLNDGPLKGVTREMIDALQEPVPMREPLSKGPKKPYTVLGTTYSPMTELAPYRVRGIGSWYGTRYHNRKTANGETYDMLRLTAAHPTLPLPSYVRVTNLENGKSLTVRVNDRGPFLHGRVIDLSYAAAYRLGYVDKGSANVEVELILP